MSLGTGLSRGLNHLFGPEEDFAKQQRLFYSEAHLSTSA
jgi:hypothetical protein